MRNSILQFIFFTVCKNTPAVYSCVKCIIIRGLIDSKRTEIQGKQNMNCLKTQSKLNSQN